MSENAPPFISPPITHCVLERCIIGVLYAGVIQLDALLDKGKDAVVQASNDLSLLHRHLLQTWEREGEGGRGRGREGEGWGGGGGTCRQRVTNQDIRIVTWD